MDDPGKYLNHKNFGVLCHKPSYAYLNNKKSFLPDALLNWTDHNHNSKMCAIFSPEHGLMGTHEAFAFVNNEHSSKWKCPIYSLHGKTRAPTQKMLSNIDTLIIDLQDVGVRCYTYLSTLNLVLKSAKDNNIEVLLLERPNPIEFWGSRGPVLEPNFESFVGKVYTPFIYGSKLGTLAALVNKNIGANLKILNCYDKLESQNYFLSNFIPPSPNLNSIDAVQAYPMTVLIEGTNYSEGRGTVYPFREIGAPWVDAHILAKNLNAKKLPGIYFEPVSFIPKTIPGMAENPKHNNVECKGVFLHIHDPQKASPVTVAQTLLKELFTLYPEQSKLEKWGKHHAIDLLIGNDKLRRWLVSAQQLTKARLSKS